MTQSGVMQILTANAARVLPDKVRAFETAIQSGDPQVMFSSGGECLAQLYGYLHNVLNMARSSPETAEEVALSILNVINKARSEFNF